MYETNFKKKIELKIEYIEWMITVKVTRTMFENDYLKLIMDKRNYGWLALYCKFHW